jgi:ethanolamine utilization protein EutQ (cupin superfamily)
VYCHCHNYKSKNLKDETIFFYDCEIKVDGVIDIIIDSNNIFKMTGNMYIPEDSQIELFGNKHVITQSYI